jgi:hypothetical protein
VGRALVKPNRGEDFYILWSNNVDGPLAWGPRAEFQEDPPWPEDGVDYSDAVFDRTDRTSCSDRTFRHSWEEDESFMYFQYGWLERSRLKEITDILEREDVVPDDHPEILALLHPFEEG